MAATEAAAGQAEAVPEEGHAAAGAGARARPAAPAGRQEGVSAGPAGRGGGFGPAGGRRAASHCSPPGSLCRRAKLLLKKKRYREQLLEKTDSQISSLEAMVGRGPPVPGNPFGTDPSLPFLGAQPGPGEGARPAGGESDGHLAALRGWGQVGSCRTVVGGLGCF